MNASEADDALTVAVQHRDEATRLLEHANNELARAESAAHVWRSNRDSAARHLAAMETWVADRERVLREATIAQEGGFHP